MKQILLAISFSFFLFFGKIFGQDAQFSQYYSSFTHLNPAMAGVIDNTKVGVQYRSQWKNVQSPYVSTLAYGAHLFEKSKSAVSFTYHGNEEGGQSYKQNNLMVGYSYNVNLSEHVKFIPAVQVGYHKETLDYSNLVFGDQFSEAGATESTNETYTGKGSISYLDFNAGFLLIGKKAFFGGAVSHLSEPDVSMSSTYVQKLNRKITVNGGVRLATNDAEDKSWLLTGLYKSQGKFDQFDIGTYLDLRYMAIGLWYRGLPIVKTYSGLSNNESIVAMAGVKIKGVTVAYSYDYVISNLSSNAHEISLYYEFRINKKQVEAKKGLPIPMF